MTRLPSPRAYAVLAVAVLLVLAARVAWGQDPGAVMAEADWTAIGTTWISVLVAGVLLAERAWPHIRDRMGLGERRHQVPPDEQPIRRGELRQAITDAAQTLRAEAAADKVLRDGEHRRIRETLTEIRGQIERLDARLTTRDHNDADRRAVLARELGQISADLTRLLAAVEDRP